MTTRATTTVPDAPSFDLAGLEEPEETRPDLGYADQRTRHIVTALKRGVCLFVRQSTDRQAINNVGSANFMFDQLTYLKPYGVDPATVTVIDARGESGTEVADRPIFRTLLAMIQAGNVGVLVLSFADRLARNERDSNAVLAAIRKVGGLLLIGGHFYDPANAMDEVMLSIQMILAKFENTQRLMRSVAGACAAARRNGYLVNLPAELVWASPADEAYKALVNKNKGEFLDAARALGLDPLVEHPERHLTRGKHNGVDLRILPYPDLDVLRSVVLRLDWLSNEPSYDRVVERILHDPEWPVPGHLPRHSGRRFRADLPLTWEPLQCKKRPDERHVDASNLGNWLRSPALAGTYKFTSNAIRGMPAMMAALGGEVEVPEAFPSYASRARLAAIREVVRSRQHPWTMSREDRGPRRARVRGFACTDVTDAGEACRGHYGMIRTGTGPDGYVYKSTACYVRGHGTQFPGRVDSAVLDLVLEALAPDRVAAAVAALRLRDDGAHAEVGRLAKRVASLEGEASTLLKKSLAANAAGNAEEEKLCDDHREAKTRELAIRRPELARALEATKASKALTADEEARVRALASDLPALLERARAVEDGGPRLMRILTRRVGIRRLGRSVLLLDVEFPTGVRERRVVFHGLQTTRPSVRLLAAARLAPWLDPDRRLGRRAESDARAARVAAQLDRVAPLREYGARWDVHRVWAAAMRHVHLDSVGFRTEVRSDDAPRVGPLEPLALVAARLERPLADVLRDALRGAFGPVRLLVPLGAAVLPPTGGERDADDPAPLGVVVTSAELRAAFRRPSNTAATLGQDEHGPARASSRVGLTEGEGLRAAGADSIPTDDGSGIASRADASAVTDPSAIPLFDEAAVRAAIGPAHAEMTEAEIDALVGALRYAPDDQRALDPRYWVRMVVAKRRHPEYVYARFHRHAYPLSAAILRGRGRRSTVRGGRIWFVWLAPSVLDRLRAPTLADAVAALGRPDLRPEDFMQRPAALALVRGILSGASGIQPGYPCTAAWRRLAADGLIVEVAGALPDRPGLALMHAHVPQWVRTATDPAVVLRWLSGDGSTGEVGSA